MLTTTQLSATNLKIPTTFATIRELLKSTNYNPALPPEPPVLKYSNHFNLPNSELTPRLKFQIRHPDLFIRLVDLKLRTQLNLEPTPNFVLGEQHITWSLLLTFDYNQSDINDLEEAINQKFRQNYKDWSAKFKSLVTASAAHPKIEYQPNPDHFTIYNEDRKGRGINFSYSATGYEKLSLYLKSCTSKSTALETIKSDPKLYDSYYKIHSKLRSVGIHLDLKPGCYHLLRSESIHSIFNRPYESNPDLPTLNALVKKLATPARQGWTEIYTAMLPELPNYPDNWQVHFEDFQLRVVATNSNHSFVYAPHGCEEFHTYLDWCKRNLTESPQTI